jgi:ribosome-binding ATPase YchF (GTP1/OBG family)
VTLIFGIVGKPSSGKSTFLNAACLTNAKVSELPFTTIDANKGVAYAKVKCVCKELNVEDNPKNSICLNGDRFIPINLLDVAGLVPNAHKGKGLGNKFLNDLSRADVLLHIVDITGTLDKSGKRVALGQNDPYEDILFLEKEIDFWVKEILEREDWNKFQKLMRDNRNLIENLYKRLSGLKIKKQNISIALKNLNLEEKLPSHWSEGDVYNYSKSIRELSKPMLIIANKIDKENGEENLAELKKKYSSHIIPCSALAEHFLRRYQEENKIKYIPGSSNFQIISEEDFTSKELEMLTNIKSKILIPFNGTGVQNALNYAAFDLLDLICVYPVYDIKTLSDKSNNILPDVFLVQKGIKLREFVGKHIHSDLAEHFMFGLDARTNKRLGEKYVLNHNDIIKIITSK